MLISKCGGVHSRKSRLAPKTTKAKIVRYAIIQSMNIEINPLFLVDLHMYNLINNSLNPNFILKSTK